MLGRLHDAGSRIPEQAKCAGDEIRKGHEISVEYRNEIRRRRQACKVPDRMIDVARFRMGVVGPRKIVAALLGAEIA